MATIDINLSFVARQTVRGAPEHARPDDGRDDGADVQPDADFDGAASVGCLRLRAHSQHLLRQYKCAARTVPRPHFCIFLQFIVLLTGPVTLAAETAAVAIQQAGYRQVGVCTTRNGASHAKRAADDRVRRTN